MSAYLLILSLLLPPCIAIDTTLCGSAKTCVQFPDGCSSANATCIYFTYAWNSSDNTFTMELSGSTGAGSKYVAVGFAQTGEMKDADVYYCTGNELKSAAIGALQSTPVVDSSLPAGVINQSSATNGGVAECVFTRPANITKNVSTGMQDFDLSSSPYFILLAAGNLTSEAPVYHGPSRWASPSAYNFVANITTANATASPATTATASPATTATASPATTATASPATTATASPATTTTASPENDIVNGCNSTKGCFRYPSDCSPGTNNCLFTSWQYDAKADKFWFQLVGQHGAEYAAVAFAPSGKMQDADLYYCTASLLVSGAIQERHDPPVLDSTLPSEITDFTVISEDGFIACSFFRDRSVNKTISGNQSFEFNLATTNYYVLLADGPLSGGKLSYHNSSRESSASAQNFTAFKSGGGSLQENMFRAHALLILLLGIICVHL